MTQRPYPASLVRTWTAPDGTPVVLRPIRPEDARIEDDFVRGLSERSRYYRFMHSLKELSPAMLARFTQPDYDREMAFIAVIERGGAEVEIGVSRYATNPDGRTCEFAIVVADAWQGRGVGKQLMRCILDSARERGLESMSGEVLAENQVMLRLMRRVGFATRASRTDPTVRIASRPL